MLVYADAEDNAMSLYFSGKDAYNSGNYEAAQKYFQEALIKDENIEAKAQNIKYMMGVSAFNNRDYKTAKTYLILYKDNPIAKDLLLKIEQYETTLPDDFLYYTDNSEKVPVLPATTTTVLASGAIENKEDSKQQTIIIIIVTTFLIMTISIFFEIKKNLFSRIALKLVGVSPETIGLRKNNNIHTDIPGHLEELNANEEVVLTEKSTASLLETPFDEEIDIEKMASKDIEEISRFFEEEVEGTESEFSKRDLKETNTKKESEEFEKARDSILNSLLEDEETDISEVNEKELLTNEQPDLIAKKDSLKPEEIAKKPKYEHLDNVPDDFNVNLAIEKAFKLIEDTSAKQQDSDNQENKEWKTVEEMEKEMEEKEKLSVDYFQELEKIDDSSLETFYDYIFDKHTI